MKAVETKKIKKVQASHILPEDLTFDYQKDLTIELDELEYLTHESILKIVL